MELAGEAKTLLDLRDLPGDAFPFEVARRAARARAEEEDRIIDLVAGTELGRGARRGQPLVPIGWVVGNGPRAATITGGGSTLRSRMPEMPWLRASVWARLTPRSAVSCSSVASALDVGWAARLTSVTGMYRSTRPRARDKAVYAASRYRASVP